MQDQNLGYTKESMSIDLDIVPTCSTSLSWSTLRSCWSRRLGSQAGLLGSSPTMRHLGTGSPIEDDDTLNPPLACYFDLLVANTLSLTALQNEGNLEEIEYLEDYGRNLSRSTVASLAQQWHHTGYSFGLSSGGGAFT